MYNIHPHVINRQMYIISPTEDSHPPPVFKIPTILRLTSCVAIYSTILVKLSTFIFHTYCKISHYVAKNFISDFHAWLT